MCYIPNEFHDLFPRVHWLSGAPYRKTPHRRQSDPDHQTQGRRGAGHTPLILEELSLEDRINDEVRVILDAYQDEMQRTGASYSEMFKKVKTELARKYKAVL